MVFPYKREMLLILTIVILVIVSFAFIQQTLLNRKPEPNSELWLLGQQHTADNYPYDIRLNENYTVFVDVKNNLGESVQYMLKVKFLNKTQLAVPSLVTSLYNTTALVENEDIWASPITFSFDYYRTASQINLRRINFNNAMTDATGSSVAWNPEDEGFFGYLYFELWVYDSTSGSFKNHDRSVNLRLVLNT